MKTVYKLFHATVLTLCSAIMLSSCDSFLDTKPYDFTAPETFYSNESECTAALAGVYYTLVYEKVYGNNYSCMISNVDDLSYYQRQSGQLASQVYGNDHNPGNQHVWGTWETLYKGINNANVFLEKKNTVMGILARVYLWRAGYPANGGQPYYAKAAYWANEVKKSNKHKMNPDIYAIWKNMAADKYDTEYNESIWEAEFIGNRTADGIGNYTDGRIGNVIGNLQKCTKATGKGYAYGFYAATLILWDLFEENDKRRDLSIAPYWYDVNDNKKTWTNKQIVQRSCGKFRREWETSSMKEKSYTPENYPILRYGDVLLMLAEAENEAHQGPTDLAYECINEIRQRAGISKLEGLSYTDFQQAVRDERARELCFESLRKYDLVRWGIYVEAVHDKLGAATQDKRWATGNQFIGARDYAARTQEKHQFLPIPTKELDVNGKLEQNKYWQ